MAQELVQAQGLGRLILAAELVAAHIEAVVAVRIEAVARTEVAVHSEVAARIEAAAPDPQGLGPTYNYN